MSKSLLRALIALVTLASCADQPTAPEAVMAPQSHVGAATTPEPVVSIAHGTWQLELWPFTSAAIAGAASDPINVVFPNRDPRAVRASLLFLNGDRTAYGMPSAPPFNCVWKDAVGGAQVTYTNASGWSGSDVQLECGEYAPMRFHLRLFTAGTSTIANGHFEVIVPGTNQHEVLSWELAERLVTVDFIRSGLLATMAVTQPINPTPTFRGINPLIYNGLPLPLRALIGGPLENVTAPVGIRTDGRASIFALATTPEQQPLLVRREFTIQFNQIIPKPFCASGPFDYLLVQGPVDVRQMIHAASSGHYMSRYHATGSLELTPVNPLTRQPIGETFRAQVNDIYRNIITDNVTLTSH